MDKVRMMKIYLLKLMTLFLVVFSLDSCQDPIFYTVAQETTLVKPLIDGSPSNSALFKNLIYVASGKNIFVFSEKKKNDEIKVKWSEFVRSDNYIVSLAATGNSLYSIIINKGNGKIRRYFNINITVDEDDDSKVNSYEYEDFDLEYNFQSIYTFGNVLFASARNNDMTYTIFYKKEGANFIEIPPIKIPLEDSKTKPLDCMLNGLASDNKYYYFSTSSGVFYVEIGNIDSSSALPLKDEEDKIITGFTGIINLNDNYVAAITKNGVLYEIKEAEITQKVSFKDNRNSTGALFIWKDKKDPTKSLLLVGRDEYYYSTISRYTNGYVEIELDAEGRIKGEVFKEPGSKEKRIDEPTTIDKDKYDQYVSSLGKKIINHFIQAPSDLDSNMTLFASTQKNGVWSYRDHGDGEGVTWNAEK